MASLPGVPDTLIGVVLALEVKVAEAVWSALMVRVQVPVPEQAPPQPLKLEPLAEAAVRVTLVPLVKLAEQVDPQLMPAGELVRVPLPVPLLETVKL